MAVSDIELEDDDQLRIEHQEEVANIAVALVTIKSSKSSAPLTEQHTVEQPCEDHHEELRRSCGTSRERVWAPPPHCYHSLVILILIKVTVEFFLTETLWHWKF